MMSVMGLSANNPDTKRGICHTRILWQLTHQSLLMRPTPWRRTAGFIPRSPSFDYFIIQSIKTLWTQCSSSEA
jgi:hypothetical protein